MPPARFWELHGKTVASVGYTAPDTADNKNGLNETVIVTFTDGTVLRVWSYGYSLDVDVNFP